MSRSNGRQQSPIRGLVLGLLVMGGVLLTTWPLSRCSEVAAIRERAYPLPDPKCGQEAECAEKSTRIEAREAVTADAALDIQFMQLALGVAGIFALGFTIYYAHMAWEEAQRSTETARKALRQSTDVAVSQLRAYVFVESGNLCVGVRDLTGDGSQMAWQATAKLQLSNKGQTPAYRVRHWSDAVFLPCDEEAALAVPPLTLDFAANIPPGGPAPKTTGLDQPITPAQVAQLAAGTHAIFIYGRIEYEDAFRKQRWSSYRLSYSGAFPPPVDHNLMFCAQGNDSDQSEQET